MISEVEPMKTNEFLRRRKLRLQQVREQSKDIAKKIRQRVHVEKLQQTTDLDAKKQREYFDRQEKLVQRLEQLYANGVKNVGASHRSAAEVNQPDNVIKLDLSKLRGREAAAELKKRKQDKLDEQKKLLDRKLQAREAANEISREKSSVVANKLLVKPSTSKDNANRNIAAADTAVDKEQIDKDQELVKKNDMATQWDSEEQPNDWAPTIPSLSLPKDDRESLKESESNIIDTKSDKSKRLDLFALSKEMPPSLRGGNINIPEERLPIKRSVTLVSEYLQSRGLRLREPEVSHTNRKQSEDLESLKHTIQRTRNSKPEVSGKRSDTDKSRCNSQDNDLRRKTSVTMYNHSTRNVQDIPCHDEKLVVRHMQSEEDAFSQAAKESSVENVRGSEHQKKIQDMRNKVAMTKQSVEKEYKDTMNFLNSLPKEKCSKAVKTSYMDDRRQRLLKENQQRILQQEYKKIEKECRRHHCNKSRNKSKSPVTANMDADFENSDFQYSWMPVPESDGNLAIHTIPTTTREGKGGNTVKFSKVDSYHEYRSRHKHTPPTKDTTQSQKSPKKKVVEAVLLDENCSENISHSSVSSDTSSVENLRLEKNKRDRSDHNLSDAERIIIYKILDSRTDVKSKNKTKLVNDNAKSLTSFKKDNKTGDEGPKAGPAKQQKTNSVRNVVSKEAENRVSFEHLQEGVYKTVNEKGNNLTTAYFDNELKDKSAVASDKPQSEECCSCKKPVKEIEDKGTKLDWDCCEELHPARKLDATCTKCTSTSQLPQPSLRSTPTASTSSVKNITKDKTMNPIPDGGFVKLVDEAGEETGKFYIGASGFLKDDAYEMIIQLRKKGSNDKKVYEDKETISATHETNKNTDNIKKLKGEVPIEIIDTNDACRGNNEVFEIIDSNPPLNTHLSDAQMRVDALKRDTQDEKITASYEIQQSENIRETNIYEGAAISVTEKNNLVDKSVGTSFHLSYAVPSDAPKIDSLPRPATSTFTQTTLSSPRHRPALIHMSSSSSTAYMSPPEMVLPRFLRKNSTNEDDSYEPIQRVDINKKHKSTGQRKECNCKRCVHLRKDTHKTRNKFGDEKILLNTPPNTARSCKSENRNRCKHEHRMDPFHSNLLEEDNHFKCRNQKYVAHPLENACTKSDPNRYNHNLGNKRPTRSIHTHIRRNVPKDKKKSTNSDTNKATLNPIVKNYVNKLLNLNKEGLKMIQVADQDCSSVTTPGSSIINVPCNIDERKGSLTKTISFEQIKNMLRQQIVSKYAQKEQNELRNATIIDCKKYSKKRLKPFLPRKPRLVPVHKIKSLNISKHLLKSKISHETQNKCRLQITTSTTDDNTLRNAVTTKSKYRSKSSPTPRQVYTSESGSRFTESKLAAAKQIIDKNEKKNNEGNYYRPPISNKQAKCGIKMSQSNRASMTSTSPDSESAGIAQTLKTPVSMSTQTGQNRDSEVSFMKVAEGKLQNMEKIADLTEKCTKRLSNLAKVLEEVRRNKSLAYSQISTSDTTSDSGEKSEKGITFPIQNNLNYDANKEREAKPLEVNSNPEKTADDQNLNFLPFLKDIPRPVPLNINGDKAGTDNHNTEIIQDATPDNIIIFPTDSINTESISKCRAKPPPALSRIQLKHGQEYVVPHELSTVIEVDSPMSIKHRSCRSEMKNDAHDNSKASKNQGNVLEKTNVQKDNNVNPDLLDNNQNFCKRQSKSSSAGSSDDSKLQMIDLKQFNKIMLQPFISIQEYAKQYNIEQLDEGSNIDDIRKDVVQDEISSLHSDGSLPDVIAELLKRNIITEPFKFDTSNINSTTISTESTMSVLALSKARKDKKKTMFMNKENVGETSDSLSISSNPDLENAFKKLGMGWASSTLKKTKERLALSSSSNTSSSSVSQFKIKNQDIPVLVTDSVSSVLNLSRKGSVGRNINENLKNVEQQTSHPNSMTVRDFLTNELAKKITFTNRSKNDTEEEFVSLFETKMPDEMKHLSGTQEEHTLSPNDNRARTSTPVQMFKSMTYHSSSSSNMSNDLFSNADDLSSVKMTSNSMKNHSTSDKDDLTVPNISLRTKKTSDCSKSD